MKINRNLSRRSFLSRVAGGTLAGGGALAALSGCATSRSVTDRDPTDEVGSGRGGGTTTGTSGGGGGGQTGYSDRDAGDPMGGGRRGGGRGTTDLDPRDRSGTGRGSRVCSDSDGGSSGDPQGRGRRC